MLKYKARKPNFAVLFKGATVTRNKGKRKSSHAWEVSDFQFLYGFLTKLAEYQGKKKKR